MFNIFLSKVHKAIPILTIITTVSVLLGSVVNLFFARIPFWYDPGRDLLLGLDNLKHFTLIGQPTGIPGIFYGPYWIWGISLAELVSKNPTVISFLILTIPYFTIFPLILYKFNKALNRDSLMIVWMLFILSYSNYFTSIWNPHLMPLFFLIFIYSLINFSFDNINNKNFIRLGFAGFILGIAINYSMSFGIGITFGVYVYFIVRIIFKFRNGDSFTKKLLKLILKVFLVFMCGFMIALLPFIIFEVRHGFNQINGYMDAFSASINNVHIVTQMGLSKSEIILQFLKIPGIIFQMNFILVYLIIFIIFIIAYFNRKLFEEKMSKNEINLTVLLLILTFSTLLTYLFSKNPVWDYHFIGFEIIFLLIIGLLIKHFPIIKHSILVLVLFLFIQNCISTIVNLRTNPLIPDSLKAKELVVESIYADNGNKNLTVFAYNPAIYTFDYDYLFKYSNFKTHFVVPDSTIINSENIYFIFPRGEQDDIKGFINSKTPDKFYTTVRQWNSEDGVLIIKRQLILN